MTQRVQRRGPAGIWGRRLIAIPVFFVATVLAVLLLPLILVASLVVDAFRRGGMKTTRTALLMVAGMVAEIGGLILAFGIWVITGFGLARNAFERMSAWLQIAWGALLFRMAVRAFRMRITFDGREVLVPGPLLIFMRHTSVLDTLSPAELIARATGIRPRYVMKRELLWSPGINVMGTRTPNCFVRRGAGGESRYVGMLADDLGPRDAVLIYPEGMVVTPAKAAAMADNANQPRRRGYVRVYPPRLGGPLALLERSAGTADVVFVGHVGFEVGAGWRQILSGDLLDAQVRFECWRLPASDIPSSRSQMADWLNDRWHEMDAWVARTQDEMGVEPAHGL